VDSWESGTAASASEALTQTKAIDLIRLKYRVGEGVSDPDEEENILTAGNELRSRAEGKFTVEVMDHHFLRARPIATFSTSNAKHRFNIAVRVSHDTLTSSSNN
jgi:hypothetical protein